MTQLAQLLGNNHPLFAYNIAQLERAAGETVDLTLLSDVHENVADVIRRLGLDPANTAPRELYHALNATVARGDAPRLLRDCKYTLALIEDELVSLNSQDVIENAHHELDFGQRTFAHAQRHLRAEIIRRYAMNERTHTPSVHELAQEMDLKKEGDDAYTDAPKCNNANGPSILVVGDIFTDAFIKLREDYARIDEDENGDKRLSLPFGSKPPYEQVDLVHAVGPSPNAGVSCARLGAQVDVMAWVGDDTVGQDMREYLHEQCVATDSMVTQADTKSNYYYVLRYGADRTILVKNEKYDYTWKAPAKKPQWIYLSLISKDAWQLHEDLLDYLDENPDIKLAFQPGTFHFEWGKEKLARVYKRSHIVVMNREEAVDVTGRSYDNIQELANGLHELGPEKVVITDGPNGSYASYDYKLMTIPNYPDPAPPLDRTGAGDAFASTIVAALALGESMDTALTWAPINSMNVVQKLGAQAGLVSRAVIEEYLKKAPDWYKLADYKQE